MCLSEYLQYVPGTSTQARPHMHHVPRRCSLHRNLARKGGAVTGPFMYPPPACPVEFAASLCFSSAARNSAGQRIAPDRLTKLHPVCRCSPARSKHCRLARTPPDSGPILWPNPSCPLFPLAHRSAPRNTEHRTHSSLQVITAPHRNPRIALPAGRPYSTRCGHRNEQEPGCVALLRPSRTPSAAQIG